MYMSIKVIYWSQTGNTEAMANAVAEGVKAAGKEVEVLQVSAVSVGDIANDNCLALGCPAMGAEQLEESEFEPFLASIEGVLSGKKVALFGSWGWGNGEYMREFESRITNAGATIVNGAGVTCQEAPDGTALTECQELGKALAA